MKKLMTIFLVTFFIVNPVSAATVQDTMPDWVVETPQGHGAYCVSMKIGIENARFVATQFAKEDAGVGVTKQEAYAKEELTNTSNKGAVETNYEMKVKVMSIGVEHDSILVEEKQVNGELCVLVALQ